MTNHQLEGKTTMFAAASKPKEHDEKDPDMHPTNPDKKNPNHSPDPSDPRNPATTPAPLAPPPPAQDDHPGSARQQESPPEVSGTQYEGDDPGNPLRHLRGR
jgi:hypothetical protein